MSDDSMDGPGPDEKSPSTSTEEKSVDKRKGLQPGPAAEVLGAHMSTLRSSTDWGITIAITSLLLAMTKVEFQIFGVVTGDLWAYYSAATIYLVVIISLGCQLLRLGYLVEITRALMGNGAFRENRIALAAPIITYPWLFNPFTYCAGTKDYSSGKKKGARDRLLRHTIASTGGVALILAWWIGFVGLKQIHSNLNRIPLDVHVLPWQHYTFCIAMHATGLFVIFAIWNALCALSEALVLTRTQEHDNNLVPYENTVVPKLSILAVAQLAIILLSRFSQYVAIDGQPLWLPSEWWREVSPTLLVPALLLYLPFRFRKKIKTWEDLKEQEGAGGADAEASDSE